MVFVLCYYRVDRKDNFK